VARRDGRRSGRCPRRRARLKAGETLDLFDVPAELPEIQPRYRTPPAKGLEA